MVLFEGVFGGDVGSCFSFVGVCVSLNFGVGDDCNVFAVAESDEHCDASDVVVFSAGVVFEEPSVGCLGEYVGILVECGFDSL